MPMIDVSATTGTFGNKHQLAPDLAKAVMRREGVPELPLVLDNTAAFIHDSPPGAISNAAGNSNYRSSPGSHPHQCSGSISVNSLTTPKLTEIVTAAAGDPTL